MDEIDIGRARAELSKLVARVGAGEMIALTRYGKVVARLVPPDPIDAVGALAQIPTATGITIEPMRPPRHEPAYGPTKAAQKRRDELLNRMTTKTRRS